MLNRSALTWWSVKFVAWKQIWNVHYSLQYSSFCTGTSIWDWSKREGTYEEVQRDQPYRPWWVPTHIYRKRI